MNSRPDKPFVLLDRDGTIIVEQDYLSDPDQIVLVPSAIEGMKALQSAGFGLAIVTNQSGIARGYFDHDRLAAIHQRLEELLAAEDIRLDGIFYCPHTPDDKCDCRKPAPGLAEQAAAQLGFAPSRSFVIGDKACDVDLGRVIGATTFLVGTGYGADQWAQRLAWPDFVVSDLIEAAAVIKDISPMTNSETPDKSDMSIALRKHVLASIDTKQRLLDACEADILELSQAITRSMAAGGKLLLCGNGGSAADCQHIAAELVSRLSADFPRPGLPAIALTTDSSMLTASANDFGFDGVFSRQVQALGRAGDVVIGISTSGNSKNVLAALEEARAAGMVTVSLTGGDGGASLALADICVRVPSKTVQYIQESHIMIGHIICALVERALFPDIEGSGDG